MISIMKRIFIAIKVNPGETFSELISTFRSDLRNDNIKWINPENIHITLVFLGNTEENLIKDIGSMLEKICKNSGVFDLVIRGTGVFRNINDPRIIWTNIDHSEKLLMIADKILSGLTQMNIKLEDKPFKPHITIGRIKHLNNKDTFRKLTEKYQTVELQKIHVSEVILYESILLEHGPKYVPLAKFSLE
jgi:RNA 2',3'-cyclic 3'-phosphodiesterase